MSIPLKRTIIFSVLFIPVLLFSIFAVLFFYLPDYIETKLVHFIPEITGIDRISLDVRKITPFETDIASLVIGDTQHPALKIDAIRSDYSPKGLSERSIKNVVISGAQLSCEYLNGKFNLQGLDQKKITKTIQSLKHRSENQSGVGSAARLPLLINRIELRDVVVICRYQKIEFRLPIEVVIIREKDAQRTYKGIVKLYPRGQTIIVTVYADLINKKARVAFKGNCVRLERFTDLARILPGLMLGGAADLEGTADFRFDPLNMTGVTASCTIHGSELAYKGLLVQGANPLKKQIAPIKIDISGKGLKKWDIYLSSLVIRHPLYTSLNNLSCHLNIADRLKEVHGIFSFKVNSTTHLGRPFKIDDTIPVHGSYQAKVSKNEAWEFNIKTDNMSGREEWKLHNNDFKISIKPPEFIVSGKGIGTRGMFGYNLGFSGFQAASKYGSVKIPEAAITGNADLDFSGNNVMQSTFKCNLTDTHFSFDSAKINAPQVSIIGKVNGRANNRFEISGVTNILNTTIRDLKHKIQANGIGLVFPFSWPPGKTEQKGALSIKSIYRDSLSIGSVKGTMKQQGSGVKFNGKYTSDFLHDFSVDFQGTSSISHQAEVETEVSFNIPEYFSVQDIDLGQFFKTLKGIRLNGRLSAGGSLLLNRTGTDSRANIQLTDGKIVDKEKNLRIQGIRADLIFTNLFNPHSAPEQKISFNSASLGEIAINNGKILFQIESPNSFFIEKSSFNWCNGNVYAHAIRVSPGIKDYNLTLFCDRMNLAMLLRQFGTLHANGEGSVNGRIPVRFHKGKISFNDGFLYSTPGNGGTVKVTGTEILTAGIPPDTLQYAQVELAREALKDYTYKWVKLGLMTEEENLHIKMEFDGKPSHPLPFVYNQDIGGFTKVRGKSKGSHFQGISLDVNFRVPLNEILQYGEGLNELIKKIN